MKKIRRFFQQEVVELQWGWYGDQFLTDESTVIQTDCYLEPRADRLAVLIVVIDLIIITLFYS